MTNPNQPNFNPGGIKDTNDSRDYQWNEIALAPPIFDWNKGFDIETLVGKLPVKDQGDSSSCGGQSFASYGNVLSELYDGTGKLEDHSAKFIYAQAFAPGGGSAGRNCANIVINQGWARESVLSSEPPTEANLTRINDITAKVRRDAMDDKAVSYAAVDPDIETVAQAIRNNSGCVIGISGSNNGSWSSPFPNPPKSGATIWRHWVYAGKAKIINGRKFVGILNSWGIEVGEFGWQWISEDYFSTTIGTENAVWAAWTLVFNPTPHVNFKHTFNIDMGYGQTSEEVKALQIALQVEGSYPPGVPITGYYGDITKQAVSKFQYKYAVANPLVLWWNGGKGAYSATRNQLNILFSN